MTFSTKLKLPGGQVVSIQRLVKKLGSGLGGDPPNHITTFKLR